MRSVVDQDHAVLERWADMADADTSVVFDAHIAGIPVSVIGIESRVIPRKGWSPADGPDQWTSGTLFPQSSKNLSFAVCPVLLVLCERYLWRDRRVAAIRR
jgi:hypothetical protein